LVSDVDPVLIPLNKSLSVGHHSLGTERHITGHTKVGSFMGSPRYARRILNRNAHAIK
jgi:hypothetical protein